MSTLGCVDLFCGAGGFSLGFHRAGFNILSAADIRDSVIKTYSHNFPDVETYTEDITEISKNPELFLSETSTSRDDVDIVIGGPPCKGFSTAGSMNPDDPRNSLVESYLDVVQELDPKIVVLENVEGILRLENGRFADKIQSDLEDQGYNISEPIRLSSEQFGVPQTRQRVFFTGIQSGESIHISNPEERIAEDGGKVVKQERDRTSTLVTARDALSDLAFLGIGEESTSYQREPQSDYQKEMRSETNQLHNHLATNHGETVRHRLSLIPQGGSIDDIPKEYQTSKHTQQRLHPDEPAPTVTTLPEDIVHYDIPRIPTVREMARLQSFPDWFEFKGPRTTGGNRRKNSCPQYSQVGNAVPPKMAEAIAKQIMSQI